MTPHPEHRRSLGLPVRGALLALALGFGGILAVARRLEPDPRGYGTHLQLGLQPCAFAMITGRLCPTCGMTTSFAWFTRGNPWRAWEVNPAGCLLALSLGPATIWLVATAVMGKPVGFRSLEVPLLGAVMLAVSLSIGIWLFRMAWSSPKPGMVPPYVQSKP